MNNSYNSPNNNRKQGSQERRQMPQYGSPTGARRPQQSNRPQQPGSQYKPQMRGNNPSARNQNAQGQPSGMTPELIKEQKRKNAQKKMLINNAKHIGIIMAVVIVISTLIASVTISCINDVLPIHISERGDKTVSVVIEDGMDTNDVINALDRAGAVKNGWFCKLAAKVIGYSDKGYIARTYEFHRSMGLENMLNEIKNKTSKAAKTITLTFPEGYTADQIIAMLEENKVCTRGALNEAMKNVDFGKDFDFLLTISEPDKRYMKYEGFLFPDTYDFYLGENAESVLRKFFNNFAKKWSEDYAKKMQEKQLSIDQVIKLASIVEKEAVSEDMQMVASILFNRLDRNMRLECNSTRDYMKANGAGLSDDQIKSYDQIYDTYDFSGLPAGAICNPGTDAIAAVLNAPDTDYYYFMHDKNNEMHIAKTLEEHNKNIANYGLAQ